MEVKPILCQLKKDHPRTLGFEHYHRQFFRVRVIVNLTFPVLDTPVKILVVSASKKFESLGEYGIPQY